jgi:hypothetical protein
LQFVRYLREKLEKEDLIPSRQFLEKLRTQRRRIVSIHVKLRQNSDGGMASSMYQDGVLHALNDVLMSTALGTKRNEEFETELGYATKTLRQSKKEDDPIEVAYWGGRKEVMERFCHRDSTAIPPFFHPQKLTPIKKFIQGRAWK